MNEISNKDSLPEFKPGRHSEQTDDCLSTNRILAAIMAEENTADGVEMAGIELTTKEAEHLETCEFCKRQKKSFMKLPSDVRRLAPTTGPKVLQIPFRPIIKIATVALILVLITGAGYLSVKNLLKQAAYHQHQLKKLHEAIGLEQALSVDFLAEQPNVVGVNTSIDPVLIRSVAVTWDNGESWHTLYSRDTKDLGGFETSRQMLTVLETRHFSAPPSGVRRVKVRVRAEYISEIQVAFPEYRTPEWTDRIGIYEITKTRIIKLANKDIAEAKADILMGTIALQTDRWEVTNSSAAIGNIENDPTDGALVLQFDLGEVGEYINISHAVPGANSANLTNSLEELSNIEIQFVWDQDSPITLEPKLVDDHGRTIGITKFIEPSDKNQTIRIHAQSLKGYWGTRNFNFSCVRRFELAVVCKVKNHATKGIMKVQRIDLIGTNKLPEEADISPSLDTMLELPLEPAEWKTTNSKHSINKLSGERGLLACSVHLPIDVDRPLPWTNLETNLRTQDFGKLQAIELELMWQSNAPITLEPKLVTSPQHDTYGRHIRILPSTTFQKIRIYPQDLKYYWSPAGTTEFTRMNLEQLNTISLGISRKAKDQAQEGTLHFKAIHLLGLAQSVK